MVDPALRVLIVDDEEIVLRTLGDYLRDCGHWVTMERDGIRGLERMRAEEFDLALVDVQMPGMDGIQLLARAGEAAPETQVVIISGHGSMEMVIQALRRGAADFLPKPVKLMELDAVLEKTLRLRELIRERGNLRQTLAAMQPCGAIGPRHRGFVGSSGATRQLLEEIRRAADMDCDTVLITGETGTGKEVAARQLHTLAGPEHSPFIAVSCPALPDTLVESELFGHVRGAFTGATGPRAGCFELASGGTLFLDEVADLSPAAQAKLLRAIETRTVRRVGGSREISVRIRIVAASNAPLEERVRAGTFRQDLYYRLNLMPLTVLPLRKRPEDIVPLAEHFLDSFAVAKGLRFSGFSEGALQRLLNYPYPGNARELRNIVERAAILRRAGQIRSMDLYLPDKGATRGALPPDTESEAAESEREQILSALTDARWNRRQAARNLQMPYSTLRYKLQKYGIR